MVQGYGLSGLKNKQGFKNSDLLKLSKLIKNYNLEFLILHIITSYHTLKFQKLKVKKKLSLNYLLKK